MACKCNKYVIEWEQKERTVISIQQFLYSHIYEKKKRIKGTVFYCKNIKKGQTYSECPEKT